MRLLILLTMLVLLVSFASAECFEPTDGMTITEDVVFCSKAFTLPNGLIIGADNINIDCNTAILRGNMQEGTGILIEGRKNVRIENCNIVTYRVGAYIKESSHITFTKNNLLKNRIGIRLFNAYENTLSDNADKSTQDALNIINSKFNVFLMGNKNIDESFCEQNLCNKVEDINPCENGDFYCSPKCNPSNDDDCKAEQPEIKFEKEPEEKIEEVQEPIETPTAKVVEPQIPTNKSNSLWIIYPLFYVVIFFMLQFYTYVEKE